MKKVIFLMIMLLVPVVNVHAFSSNAKGTVLMDTDSKRILYAENAHYTQSVASISKIMTAIVAIENSNIKKTVTVGDEILKAYGSGIYVQKGEKITLEDLLYGLMLRSGNDAALVIAKNVSGSTEKFVKKMNETAKKIGMNDTTFNNPSGLDEEKGNISSAYDMALLMSYAMQNPNFREITKTKVHTVKTNKNFYKWHNKNKLLNTYKYTTGGKTGFTKKAKRTLVTTASKNGLNLTVVTINDGSDWKDHKSLYEEAFKNYTSYTLIEKGNITILGENYYKGNTLFIKKDLKYPLSKSEKEAVMLKYKIDKKRNFTNHTKIGTVNLYIGDKKVTHQNIYINKGESKQTLSEKIKSWLNNDK
ncbi:MAG: D-alanyl-D-alanine carboxypeptidase [Bacilli bacterium]|nr:D-alanyl-D-alanine carboxypeptidase [Bacilli bacterium]